MVLKGMFLFVIKTCISIYIVVLRCIKFSDWLIQNVNKSGMGICCHMCCVSEIDMVIPFFIQYRYVTNHLHLYVTNNYIILPQIPSYCLLCVIILSMSVSPVIHF